MVQISVMSVFCIILLVYGYSVVFKKGWFTKVKNDSQSSINKMRNIMGTASLFFGVLGLVVNAALAYVLIRGISI
ncbi:MAG: hypothetical protein Q9P44_17020 [Anaerolineae bacterium]|nr:hypothetical protein [Anaerolineae bacterium]